LVVACFGGLILLGSLLLTLPVSRSGVGPAATIGDAFFTAASAVTVTGLAVVDTAPTWSPFGELVILFLIQIGGLGIMTLAGFLAIVFTRRLGVRGGMLVGAEIGLSDLGALRGLVRNLVVFVAGSELVITVLLTVRFALEGERSLLRSLYMGLFHAVSAFNNAGFSTIDGGLERYASDWFVSLVITAAFVIGGLGFPVVFELWQHWSHPRRWSLHTKVTLTMTVALLAVGTAAIAAVEWDNGATIGEEAPATKILASFFQSATTRTAGFNTVPVGELRFPTLLLFLLLMVVGASSASTGGGIKTSTLAVVIKATVAELRGDPEATMFARRIPESLERRALSLVIAALGAIGTATFLLTVFDPDLPAIDLLFEAASAFGTVGLSTGLTPDLSGASRVVIVVLMFLGRVGPITFGSAVLLRPQLKRYGFAEEGLIVG
jgi:potassium uptake TrkH family protein